jgi:hypothetical protein
LHDLFLVLSIEPGWPASQIPGGLKIDSLVDPGDQGDGYVVRDHLPFGVDVWQRPSACVKRGKRNIIPLYTEHCSV